MSQIAQHNASMQGRPLSQAAIKPDFFLVSESDKSIRIPITRQKDIIGRYVLRINDNRVSRNQAEVWADGEQCYFRQVGVNPSTIESPNIIVGVFLAGKDQTDGELAIAYVVPENGQRVRTTPGLVYVLENGFTVYMLHTKDNDLAPFQVVAAKKCTAL